MRFKRLIHILDLHIVYSSHSREIKAPLVSQVLQVREDCKDYQAGMALMEFLVLLDQLDYKGHQDLLAHQALEVSMIYLAKMVVVDLFQ